MAWSSDDPEVVTVSPSGRARGVSADTTRIRARLGEASASVPVRVLEAGAPEGKGGIEGRGGLEGKGGPGGRGRAATPASGRSGGGSSRESGRAAAKERGWRRGSVLAAAAVAVLAVLALAVWRPWSDGTSPDPVEPAPSGSPAVATPAGEDGSDGDGAGPSSEAATVGSSGQGADGSADADGGESGGEVAAAGSSTEPTASADGASGSSSADPDASSAGEEAAASEPSADGAAGPTGEPATGLVRLAGAVPDAPRAVARPVGGGRVRPFLGDSIALPPGEYDLELVGPDDRIVRETVRVAAGETVEWSVPDASVADAGDAANDGGAGAADGGGTPEAGADGGVAAGSASEIERARSQAREAVDAFVEAFGARRTGEVVPLLPASAREGWRALLESDDVENFTASLSETEEPRIDLDAGSGSVEFSVDLAYRNLNRNVRQGLSLSGELERRSGSWVLTAVSILP